MKEEKSQEKNLQGKTFNVLNHGFIKIVDTMGNDSAIVQSARVSYGDGTKTVNEDKGLINYLMKHQHTSPFEMCEIKLHIKAPLFVARQWIRHRTANVNEISARYSILPKEYYVPELEDIQGQSATNKQCRGDELTMEDKISIQEKIEKANQEAYDEYEKLIKSEVAREIARGVLPLNMFTEWYWKIDMHNLLHFIKLRIHPHAQYEIRVYAEILGEIVKEWCPIAWSAFEEHILYAQKFSRTQIEVLKNILQNVEISSDKLSKRELEELKNIFNNA